MAIFDSLINEVASRFGLGDKAGSLLAGLLSLLTNTESGGLSGIVSKFTQAGLGNVVNSWISRGENTALSTDQLTRVLGNDTVSNLAEKAGVSSSVAAPALAFMLPKVVDSLTPDGVVPARLPDTIMNYISGLSGFLGKGVSGAAGAVGAGAAAVGAGLAGAAGTLGSGAQAATQVAGETAKSGMSGLLRLLPLLLLLLVAFLGYRYCSVAPEQQQAAAASPSVAVAPSLNSKLDLTVVDGRIKAAGLVPDEATKTKVLDQLKAAYGEGKYVDDKITVDAKAKPAEFAANLNKALGEFKLPGTNGSQLSFDGSAINITGLAAAAADALKGKLAGFFGNLFNVNVKVLDVAAAVKEAAAAASTALAGLKPGFTADELVKALNLEIINFASGSNGIPKENEELLRKSADAIKQVSAGTKLEVGGHTDNKGNAAGNQKLSQARAEAVKAFLVKQGVKADLLTAKGYGSDKAMASNDTEEGRFKNRRIEFSVVK